MLGDWGRYRLESFLAKGGMAEVYKAKAIGVAGFERTVCVKRVLESFSDDPLFIEMFEREARIAAGMQHPNIVQVTDFDRYNGWLFLVMDYVDGMDLRRIKTVASRLGLRLPLGFALHVLSGLLEALGYAHGHTVDGAPRPVIHRDVSPQNLMVSTDGHVKLTDFGIAKALGGTNATRTGFVKGKLAYMSPEQAAGAGAETASDLFSAGVVFWELLAWRRLFYAETQAEIIAKVIRCEPPKLTGYSPGINELVDGLLAKDPAARFSSAGEVLAALRALDVSPCNNQEAGKLVSTLVALEEHMDELEEVPHRAGTVSQPPASQAPAPSQKPTGDYRGPDARTRLSETDLPISESASSIPPPVEKARSRARFLLPGALILILGLAGGFGISLLNGGQTSASKPSDAPASSLTSNAEPQAAPLEEPEKPAVSPETGSAVVRLEAEVEESPPAEGERLDGDDAAKGEVPAAAQGQGIGDDDAAERPGFLRVNCRPWAKVRVDGKLIGTTPIKRLKLGPGMHKVRLSNEALGYEVAIPVRIRPGKTVTLNREIPSEG